MRTRFADAAIERIEKSSLRRPFTGRTVGVIVVGWTSAPTVRAMNDVERWAAKSPHDCVFVLVANRPEAVVERSNWSLVRGTNRAGEFSGYDEGVALLKDLPIDCFVIMNDRQDAYGGSLLPHVTAGVIEMASREAVLIGRREAFGRSTRVGAAPLPHYIQSHCFVVGSRSLAAIGRLAVYAATGDSPLFADGWPIESPGGRGESWIAEPYSRFLAAWLTGAGLPLTSYWYRASSDESRLAELQAKAVSIMNEHQMSQSAIEADVELLELEWAALSAALLRTPALLRWQRARWRRVSPSLDSRRYHLELIALIVVARLRNSKSAGRREPALGGSVGGGPA